MKFIVIKGNSMHPTLKNGNLCILGFEKNLCIKKGDIIIFKKNNNIIAHRCIYIIRNYIAEKGDNSNHISIIKKQNIIGKISYIIRNGEKNNINNFNNNYFTFLKVIIKLIFFIIKEFYERNRNKKLNKNL